MIDHYYETIASQLEYRIASEWDMIEQKLNDPEFWAFIYGKDDGKYQTRIELLFDLIVGKKIDEQDKYYTFSEYDKAFREEGDKHSSESAEKNPDNLLSCRKWREVIDWFYTFCSWFEERDIYHYVGFLRYKKKALAYIKTMYEKAVNHSAFMDSIRDEALYNAGIKNRKDGTINDITEFCYPDDAIRDTLLLFNIESIRKTKSEERFSFSSYYTQEYDIEHIKPRTPKDFESNEDWEGLVRSSLEYLTGCQYLDKNELRQKRYAKALRAYADSPECSPENGRRIIGLIEKRMMQNPHTISGNKLIDDIDIQLYQCAPGIRRRAVLEKDCQLHFIEELGKLDSISNPCDSDQSKLVIKLFEKYKDIYQGHSVSPDFFTEDEKYMLGIENDSGPDTIGNLVLLDRGTNRSYKNASFIVKRYYIQKQEENGVYIPRSTRDVFNKMYSSSVAEPMRWTEQDMRDYAEAIMEVLK